MSGADTLTERTYSSPELQEFSRQVEKFISGGLTKDQFKAARLGFGIYALRQPGYFLIRTKLAGGAISAKGLLAAAEAAEKFGEGPVRLTTRQDFQLYFVKLENLVDALDLLNRAGITTIGAAGNTLRNMVVSATAPIDVTEAARRVSQYFSKSPLSKGLPRKVKITFTGNASDAASAMTDDIGLIALGPKEGYPEFGFRVYVGGGLGAVPRLGFTLEEFVPAGRIHEVILAIVTLFNRNGQRVNRNRARIKFYIENVGVEMFKDLYRRERENFTGIEPIDLPIAYVNEVNGEAVYARGATGDVTPQQLRSLAAALEAGRLSVNITRDGTLAVHGFGPDERESAKARLKEIGLEIYVPERSYRVLACNGATTCSEGIANSKGVARRLEQVAKKYELLGYHDFTIAASGCPNACSRHHTADIGLSGSAKKVNGKLAPHYQLYVGGVSLGQTTVFGRPLAKIPARRVPEAVDMTLSLAGINRLQGERLSDTFARIGLDKLESALSGFSKLPSFDENPDSYYDWDTQKEFSLDEVGPGECAGSALELIDGLFDEARRYHTAANGALKQGNGAEAAAAAHDAVLRAAKALLVTYGIDPATEEETFREFNTKLVTRGFVPERYKVALVPAGQKAGSAAELVAMSGEFLEDCLAAYTTIHADSNEEQTVKKAKPEAKRLDLTGVKCPYNYIKVKLFLEMAETGTRVEVILDDGAPIKNVPQSLRNDGHTILSSDPFEGGRHLLMVEKG
ncbi:MAG: sulfurtransferase TusA family protein [Nitrospinae bacterium]|nr:sulfurtransferase TusA family protein [Nitrospinota bacterium]